MIVVINGVVHNSKNTPITIKLDEEDKQDLQAFICTHGAYTFTSFPIDSSEDQIEKYKRQHNSIKNTKLQGE